MGELAKTRESQGTTMVVLQTCFSFLFSLMTNIINSNPKKNVTLCISSNVQQQSIPSTANPLHSTTIAETGVMIGKQG